MLVSSREREGELFCSLMAILEIDWISMKVRCRWMCFWVNAYGAHLYFFGDGIQSCSLHYHEPLFNLLLVGQLAQARQNYNRRFFIVMFLKPNSWLVCILLGVTDICTTYSIFFMCKLRLYCWLSLSRPCVCSSSWMQLYGSLSTVCTSMESGERLPYIFVSAATRWAGSLLQ